MDYCSSCRRNLNGALVCPGCGDYAPDIAPPTARHRAAAAAAVAEPTWDPWQRADSPAPAGDTTAKMSSVSDAADAADAVNASGASDTVGAGASGGAATGQGRAARRRQLARWKKHRRRAAAATAFALAGGALTVALLPNKASTDQTHAAAAPKDPETENTARTSPTDAPSKKPDDRAVPHRDTGSPQHADRHRRPTTDAAPAATHQQPTTHQQSQPTAATHSLSAPTSAAPSSQPHTASAPTKQASAGSAPTAPAKTAPASSQQPAQNTSTAHSGSTAPTAEPTSPSNLCLLGLVCVN